MILNDNFKMSLSSLEFIFHIFFIFRQNISFLEPLHHFCSDQMRPTHHSLVRICPVLMLSSLLTSRCLSPPSFSNTPLPPQLQTASHADLSVSHAPATPLCSAWVIHPDPLLSAQMPLPSDLPVPLDSRTHPRETHQSSHLWIRTSVCSVSVHPLCFQP